MDTDYLTLIRRKNLAYYRLVKAEVECHKRRKRGPICANWLARLAELDAEYRDALAQWQAQREISRT